MNVWRGNNLKLIREQDRSDLHSLREEPPRPSKSALSMLEIRVVLVPKRHFNPSEWELGGGGGGEEAAGYYTTM